MPYSGRRDPRTTSSANRVPHGAFSRVQARIQNPACCRVCVQDERSQERGARRLPSRAGSGPNRHPVVRLASGGLEVAAAARAIARRHLAPKLGDKAALCHDNQHTADSQILQAVGNGIGHIRIIPRLAARYEFAAQGKREGVASARSKMYGKGDRSHAPPPGSPTGGQPLLESCRDAGSSLRGGQVDRR